MLTGARKAKFSATKWQINHQCERKSIVKIHIFLTEKPFTFLPRYQVWVKGFWFVFIPVLRLLRYSTYSTLAVSGMSAASGALSSPMLEQLTTQDGWSPTAAQLQLTGQGLQLLPPSPCGPEPHAPRQQNATSRLKTKLHLGKQTPCFRLDKVCPFPQGIAHSHLIASDGVSPLSLGRN